MSLYRKYRPQTFSHLVGQNHINRTLLNALKLERVSHAYLFTGPRGTGKTTTARLMAKAINCLAPVENEPCNKCEICLEISEGRLIDLIEIDAASNRGIDEIRELRDKINFAPSRAKSKVYIIDEVHMLTRDAFNALLKTLEEPPAHVYFILATTEAHKIPETILSRCQRFDFKRLDDAILVERLKFIAGEEGIETDEKALELVAHHAEGGMRDAIVLMEQLSIDKKLSYEHVCGILGVSGIASMEKLDECLRKGDASGALKEISLLYEEGFDLLFFNKRFLEFLRREMIKAVNAGDEAETERLLFLIDSFREAYEQARYALIPQLPMEMAVVKGLAKSGGRTIQVEGNTVARAGNGVDSGETTFTEKKVPARETSKDPLIPEKTGQEVPGAAIAGAEVPAEANAVSSGDKERLHKKIVAAGEISLDEIKNKWSEIEQKIVSPVAKRCFRQAVPARLEGMTLVAAFSNNFNMEKLMETMVRTEAEKAIHEVTGLNLKLTGEINAAAAEAEKADKQLADAVIDIFDGKEV